MYCCSGVRASTFVCGRSWGRLVRMATSSRSASSAGSLGAGAGTQD
jgi:hypothetical protein